MSDIVSMIDAWIARASLPQLTAKLDEYETTLGRCSPRDVETTTRLAAKVRAEINRRGV